MQDQGLRQYEGGQGFVRVEGQLLLKGHVPREWELRDEGFVRLSGALPEEVPKIFFNDAGQIGLGHAAEVGEALVGCEEVCGVVYSLGFGRVREGVAFEFAREGHGGGVGLDEEAAEWDVAEGLAFFVAILGEERAAEGEISAAPREAIDHLGRAAVGMKEEAAGGDLLATDDLPEGAPGAEAMDGGGEIALDRDLQLGAEDVLLVGEVESFLPAVEADLADDAAGVELRAEELFPVLGALGDAPWMEAVAGDDPREIAGEPGDGIPIVVDGAIDHGAGDAEGGESFDDVRQMGGEPLVLEMVVGVEEFHGRCFDAKSTRARRMEARPFWRVGERFFRMPRSSRAEGSSAMTSRGVAPS